MNTNGLPCCYFPSRIILVDDDKNFVSNLKLAVKRNFPCLDFQDSQDALAFIQAQKPDPFTNRCLSQAEEFRADERNVKVNIRAIHKEAFNPKRHQEISVVVVDYQMPAMDGIEFCKSLGDREHIKKIMLTGEADYGLAVRAFNNGWIDKFIKKDEAGDINEVVCQAIQEMQWQHFMELSQPVVNSLRNSPEKMPVALTDPGFAEWFKGFLKQQKYTEFYLLENQANFLLLDRSGRMAWFAVREAKEMEDLIEFAADLYAEEPNDPSLDNLNKLKAYSHLPLFYSEQDYQATLDEWSSYLHPCQTLQTESRRYYWALIEGPAAYDFDLGAVQFFKTLS